MKRILNKPIRDEKGQALILALILLVIGGLIIGPLLSYISTGLITGRVYEERMAELYAADAGVEDALWQIKMISAGLPQAGDDPWEYSIADVNDKEVDPVIITYIDDATFKITSTATTENDPTTTDDDSSTTIESYINILDFTLFTDNAITSRGNVNIQPGSEVYGDVQYNGDLDNKGTIDGEISTEEIIGWPTAAQLSAFYWEDVEDLEPYADDTINVTDTPSIGPLYSLGELLTITNQKGSEGAVGTLNGTAYVTGDLEFEQPGGKTYEINLNGQTIFALGEIRFPSAGAGEPKCTLSGSGCIIAVGDIDFHPNISSEEGDFIFVMSIEGTVNFQPNGDFYGSLAGNVNVNLQPGNTLNWVDPPDDLNLPGFGDKNVITAIRTWEIILQ